MKTIFNFRLVLIGISACFCSLHMYGQWDNYSTHTDMEHHNNSKNIYLRDYPSTDLDGFQVLCRIPYIPDAYRPIFQINTKGRMVLGPVLGTEHARLEFMQQDEKYGSINTVGEDFHVDAARKLCFGARGNTAMTVDKNKVDLFANLNISLPGLSPNAEISLYSGVNNAPTLSTNQSNKWLRIGNAGGLALFGDDTYKQSVVVPTMKLIKDWVYVKGNIKLVKDGITSYVGAGNDNINGWIGTTSGHGLYIGANNNGIIYVDTLGRTYLGLNNLKIGRIRKELKAKYRLFVSEGMLSEDYGIAPIGSWSDYVFSPLYNLRKLGDVEEFIEKHKHLPDVPSAAEVAEKGYSQHEMNKVLLQKIEELTLYTIEQEKKIDRLQEKLDALNK